MQLQDLYDLATEQNIAVIPYPMSKNGSMSVMSQSGCCYIGMDRRIQDGSVEERVHLSHELGHCMTGSFYNVYATIDNRQKHENQADKWAIKALVPQDALDAAVANGYTEIWELAEFFGVTYEFMQKAVCYYTHGNLAVKMYF